MTHRPTEPTGQQIQHSGLSPEHDADLREVSTNPDRMADLLEAVVAMSSGLDMDTTLRRVVRSATDLVAARYGAIAVVDGRGDLAEFVQVGVTDEQRARIGRLPRGRGLLGTIGRHPEAIRLSDLTEHPDSVGFPPHHPRMRRFLGVPLRVRDEVLGSLYVTDKRGGDFTAEDAVVLRTLAVAAGIVIENARLYRRARAEQRWQAATSQIRSDLLDGAGTDTTLDSVARYARDLTDSGTVVVLTTGEAAPDRLTVRAAAGDDVDDLIGDSIELADRGIGEAYRSGTSRVFGDGSTILAELGPMAAGFGEVLAVPLRTTAANHGVLLAIRDRGSAGYEPETVRVLGGFADQAAIALAAAAAQRSRRQRDVLADRERIAADLHDHVIQRLYAAGMKLQGVAARAVDTEVRERIGTVVRQLDDTIREIRTAIFDLHSDPDTDTGLRRRLLDVAAESADIGPAPSVRLAGAVDTVVPEVLAEQAIAVVREGVSNAARHARAGSITVTAEATDWLVIEVVDDGVGMDPDAVRSGLANLARRAEEHGGELTIRSGFDGTVLRWRVPLPTAEG